MIIDTHSHVQFAAFKEDADKVLERTLAAGMQVINVGTKYETSRDAVLMAEKYPSGVYAAIGLHPIFAGAEFVKMRTDPDEGEFLINEQDFDKAKYVELAKSKKVVAIGEVGLDYYYKPKGTQKLADFKAKQKQIFIQQLDLAKELNLPVILHCRMAHDDVIEILTSKFLNPHAYRQAGKSQNGLVHCFTGTLEQAKKYVALGFYIGINAIVYKFNIDEVLKEISLDNMVVETDCPYLTAPQEEGKRNEPLFIKHAIQKIADVKQVTFDQVVSATTQNAKKLFKI